MKFLAVVCAGLLFFVYLHAEQSDIDREIEKIKMAPPEERVKLMNEFKRRLFKMNQEERSAAIEHLRSSMHGNNRQGAVNQPASQTHSAAPSGNSPAQQGSQNNAGYKEQRPAAADHPGRSHGAGKENMPRNNPGYGRGGRD